MDENNKVNTLNIFIVIFLKSAKQKSIKIKKKPCSVAVPVVSIKFG